MAGNSKRQGATRRSDSKKPRSVGSGGVRRRSLEGKGPTPRAKDRTGHVANKRSRRTDKDRAGRGSRSEERTSEWVFGRNAVAEALDAGIPATELLLAEGVDYDKRIKHIMTAANRAGVPIKQVDRDELTQRSGGIINQGVAVKVAPYQYAKFADLLKRTKPSAPGLIVMLDGVTDPRNLGAIARSALAFGATGLVVPSRRSVGVTAAAWRTSAGALAHLPVAEVTNLVREITVAKEHGFLIVGLDGGAHTTIGDVPFENDPVVLVVGGEGSGIGRLVGESCDFLAEIPISSRVESLNAAVAASIALLDISRARANVK